jgi:hypothetical protein
MSGFDKVPGFEGLGRLTFAELRSSDKLVHLLTSKVQELDSRMFHDQVLEGKVRLLMDLLRETLADRYQDLSVLAFAHILVALDYFLHVMDDKPDTQSGGFSDDLQRVEKVFADFKTEIDAFKQWKVRQPGK